jgi:hypothetical protein
MLYYIFTANGWWGRGGQFTSDVTQAQTFTEAEAITFCRGRHNKITQDLTAVPVPAHLVAVITK